MILTFDDATPACALGRQKAAKSVRNRKELNDIQTAFGFKTARLVGKI